MKKFLIPFLFAGVLFAADNNDIDKKLDLILQQIQQLKQEVKQKDKEIEKLKKELNKQQVEIKKQAQNTQKQFAIKNCDRLKVISYKYTYHSDVINYYTLEVTLKNDYPYAIKFIRGSLYFEDIPSHATLLQDYISRDVNLKPGESITIYKKHILTGPLEGELKDENKKDLKVYFEPSKIIFANGQRLECN
ncbi:hypothetical protein [Caminibacter sp.]